MKSKKNFSPDELNSSSIPTNAKATNTNSSTKKETKPKAENPTKDEDWAALALDFNDYWKANTWFTIKYITQTQFEQKAIAFNSELTDRQIAGNLQLSKTATLKKIEELIPVAIDAVQSALKLKFEDLDIAQYNRYGIEQIHGNYRFPNVRKLKKKAIQFMINSLTADKLDAGKYGLSFWTQLQKDFLKALGESSDTSETINNKISAKNVFKAEVKEVLLSARNIITGNFRKNTHFAELRNAGWKKVTF